MRDLTKYRLDTAAERLTVSKEMIAGGHFKDSINRSYYAIFSAARALLSERYVDFKKHSAVISYFRREYIKTGLLDVKFSSYIGDAFRARQYSDYDDFVIVSREQAETQYQHAVEFVEAVKIYLEGGELNADDRGN